MAINPSSNATMAGRITPADADFPYGSSKNETAPGAGDGTPYFKARADDIFGFQQWLLTVAGIVPTGTADNVNASQYGQALRSIFGNVGLTVMTASGTYNPPDSAKALLVIAAAGGGGAGGMPATGAGEASAPGGGGAGGVGVGVLSSPAASYEVTVGAGGTGGGGDGLAGGDTLFVEPGGLTHFNLFGGGPGAGGSASMGTVVRTGGAGGLGVTAGGVLLPGGNGSLGRTDGGTVLVVGHGGGNFLGASVRPPFGGIASSPAVGAPPFGLGGAAPASYGNAGGSVGGSGSPGVVIIVEFFQL